MSSVDGRLIDGRWTAPYEAEYGDLLKVYASIGRELNTDAWMFGKNTIRAIFTYRFGIAGHTISSDEPAVFIGERHSKRMFIVADPEGDIYFTSPTLRGDNMLVIVGRNVTEEYLAHLREYTFHILSSAMRPIFGKDLRLSVVSSASVAYRYKVAVFSMAHCLSKG